MAERALYDQRFNPAERRAKAQVWEVLCRDYFQRYVGPDDAVLDLGAGFCEFINHISCGAKFAIDSDPQVLDQAAVGVTVRQGRADDLSWLEVASLDVVFASNFFEHMTHKDAVLATLREAHRVLRPGGRVIILQPNIRYAYKEYWDFFDHHLPFSHKSMVEALEVCGFDARVVRPRFLPYTTKGLLPPWPFLVQIYLRLPPLQWLLGKQMFIVADKAR